MNGRGLFRVTSPHFCAGAVIEAGKITETAPILKWARGRYLAGVIRYCVKRGWKYEYWAFRPGIDSVGYKNDVRANNKGIKEILEL